jgi:hypothetical protein
VVVLTRGGRVPDDAPALAAVGHVARHDRQKLGIANLENRATRAFDHRAVVILVTRLARRNASVHTEQTEQRLQLGGKGCALHAYRSAAMVSRNGAVGVDQPGEKRQEKSLRFGRHPSRDPCGGRLRAYLAIDELGRTTSRKACDC